MLCFFLHFPELLVLVSLDTQLALTHLTKTQGQCLQTLTANLFLEQTHAHLAANHPHLILSIYLLFIYIFI